MEYEGYVAELWLNGYLGRPTPAMSDYGITAVMGTKCPYCNKPMQYEGFVKTDPHWGSGYVALAVCRECNYCEEV